jgi:hypothetical protein
MALNVGCPGCGKQLRLPEALVGQLCGCPSCGKSFTVQDTAGRIAVQPLRTDGRPEPPPLPASRAGAEIPVVGPAAKALPLPAGPAGSPRPFLFRVRVFYDPARRLAGELQARISAGGLELRDRRDELFTVPIGGKARYLGGPRLAVTLDGREVTLVLTQARCQQVALARDLVLFLAGKKPPLRLDDYRPSRLLRLAAMAPLLIPLVLITTRVGGTVGAVLWCATGLALVLASWLLLRIEARSHAWRLGWTAALWVVSLVVLVPVAAAVDYLVRSQRPHLTWYTYISPDGKWRVPLPNGSRREQQQQALPGNPLGPGIFAVTTAEQRGPGGRGSLRLQVWVRDAGGNAAPAGGPPGGPEPAFAALRDAFLATEPGLSHVQTAPTLLQGQHPGMYYHYKREDLRLRMHFYRVGTVYYALVAYCRPPFGESDSDRFLTGFTLNGPAAEVPLPEGNPPDGRLPPDWQPQMPRLRLVVPSADSFRGLQLYYRFNEGRDIHVKDALGREPWGTVHGGWWVDGIDGKALMLDGQRDWCDLGGSDRLNFGPAAGFSIGLWFATPSTDGVLLSLRSANNPTPLIDLVVEAGRVKATVRSDVGGQEQQLQSGNIGEVNDGVWHHVLLTRLPDGSLDLYLDGQLRRNLKDPAGAGSITTTWRTLGCERHWVQREGKDGAYLKGCVDELCVFDRALTADEARQLSGR